MILLYGAYGYTGRITAELAVRRGCEVTLAGRNAAKVEALATELGLPWRAFGLDEPAEIAKGLEGCALVAHMAGPFSATSRPVVDACLATGTHYLDITGELSVFEAIHQRDAEAKAAGVVLMPGTGFDVVPTDCAAAKVARALPDATHLELAFASRGGGPSAGTTKTAIEGLGQPSAARINGSIEAVPLAWKTRWVDFPGGKLHVACIPWGDVSTAFYTTGIPNIITYMGVPPSVVKWMKLSAMAGPVLQMGAVQSLLKSMVERRIEGPDASEQQTARSVVFAEARNAAGDVATVMLSTPLGYLLTADASLVIAERVIAGEVEPGAWTPAGALGADFVDGLDGVEVQSVNLQRA